MIKHCLLYSFGFIIFSNFFSCNGSRISESPPEENVTQNKPEVRNLDEKVTQNGFPYVHHIQNNGRKPVPGEYVYYFLEIYGVYDSLSAPSFLEGSQQQSRILKPDQKEGFVNPVIDVLDLVSVGDSISIKVSPDYVKELQPGYVDFDHLNFCLKIHAIKAGEEHSKLQIEKFNKRKEKLLAIQSDMKNFIAKHQKTITDFKAGKLGDNLKTTSTGLKYVIHEPGTGPLLKPGNRINFFYCGLLMDGKVFENTFETGTISSTQVSSGQTMLAFEEVVNYLRSGAKVSLFAPYKLAYGDDGFPPNVPPETDVMFYMEIFE